ncbi:MAG: Ig-like domain-containing protein, partial [Prevotellaceae bacterium]|nr:Ig-like domain-containing protein [Prevotellaceae bacterium]
MAKLLVSLVMLAVSSVFADAQQNFTTAGKDFWLTFTKNLPANTADLQTEIRIATTNATNVTLTYTSLTGTGKTQNISIPENTIYPVILSNEKRDAVYFQNDGTVMSNSKSLHIISDQPVSVYAISMNKHAGDATNVLPANALGTDYYHISYSAHTDNDAMTLIATEDSTSVDIYDKNSVKKKSGTLNRGEVWHLPLASDMTGYRVVSNKPVAHFVNNGKTMLPDSSKNNADNLFQQMAPVNSWGKSFFVPSINRAGQKYLRIRIVASQDGTTIQQNGGTVKAGSLSLSKKGSFVELEINDAAEGCFITSDKPVGVCEFLLSYDYEGTTAVSYGGPAQVWIPPIEQATVKTTISPFYHTGITEHYALIITPEYNKDETAVTVSGTTSYLTGVKWFNNQASGYSFAKYPLSNASYTFKNSAGLTVLAAGLGQSESYFYLAGASAYNLNMMFKVNGTHYSNIMGQTICTNTVSLSATVLYAATPLDLKWFVNNKEIIQARNKLTCDTILPSGKYNVRLEVKDINNTVQTSTTDFTIAIPVIKAPAKIYAGKTANLLPSTGGTWKSSNPKIATVDNNGLVKSIAEGKVQFTFTSTDGCSTVSDTVILLATQKIKAVSDTILFIFNDSVKLDALANDLFDCDKSQVVVDTVAGSGLSKGSLVINADKTFTYTSNKNEFGIDSIKYFIACGTDVSSAKIYFVISSPISSNNIACAGTQISIGMLAIPDVQYYWYDAPTGGKLLDTSPANEKTITKDNTNEQSWYLSIKYKEYTSSSRYKISVFKSGICGTENPEDCATDGRLLFREDFGGNSTVAPRVSSTGLPAKVTEYNFKNTDKLKPNDYALVKYVDNVAANYSWQQKFSDHTNLNDLKRGYMFLVDADDNPGKFYETKITGLCDNIRKLYFSVWVANVIPANNTTAKQDPRLKFDLYDSNNNLVGTYTTPKVPRDAKGSVKWRNYGLTFNPNGRSSLILKIYNNEKGSNGNDFAIDDIEIHLCVPSININTPLSDTVCFGSSYTFNASYTDDGTYGNLLTYRWEYSAVDDTQATWTTVKEGTANSSTLNTSFTLNNIAVEDEGYYRLLVANSATIDYANCRNVSKSTYLHVKTHEVHNDVAMTVYDQPIKNINVMANDSLSCCTDLTKLKIDTVAG